MHGFVCSENVQIQHIDDRGCGVFAAKAFEVGDEIIRESPILIVPNSVKISSGGARAAKALAQRESMERFERLSSSKQSMVMSFTDAHNLEPTPWGVMQTNCIPMYTASDKPATESGVFSLACRINHGCIPNARYLWRADLDKQITIAMRPIAKGDEITVQYINTYCPRPQRRALFQAFFNFTCRCDDCYKSSDESDKRLSEIQQLIDRFPNVAMVDSERALKMSERTLHLLKIEGRDTPLATGTIHYDAYRMAKQNRDDRKANEHLQAAWECAELSEGPSGPLAAKYANMAGRHHNDEGSESMSCDSVST